MCRYLELQSGRGSLVKKIKHFFTSLHPMTTLCWGHSYEMSKVVAHYNGEDMEILEMEDPTTNFITVAQMVIVIELTCYIILHGLKYHDGFSGPRAEARIRNRRNCVTLTGQVICFGIELSYSILVKHFMGTSDIGMVPIITLLLWTLITITHILTSPNMRGHIFGF